MLNKPSEAAQHLSPTSLGLVNEVASHTPNVNLPTSPYSPFNSESNLNIRYTLYVNLAVVHILKVRSNL